MKLPESAQMGGVDGSVRGPELAIDKTDTLLDFGFGFGFASICYGELLQPPGPPGKERGEPQCLQMFLTHL